MPTMSRSDSWTTWVHPVLGGVALPDAATDAEVIAAFRLAGGDVDAVHDDHAHDGDGQTWECGEGGLTEGEARSRCVEGGR